MNHSTAKRSSSDLTLDIFVEPHCPFIHRNMVASLPVHPLGLQVRSMVSNGFDIWWVVVNVIPDIIAGFRSRFVCWRRSWRRRGRYGGSARRRVRGGNVVIAAISGALWLWSNGSLLPRTPGSSKMLIYEKWTSYCNSYYVYDKI